ncbi:MAG: SH3 domain-containing protein [Lachnospiraceae bacterium]|nr:SH3 domain-containing protein [Lachnospiraceae bacterium]
MKNRFSKFIIGALIAATAATTAFAPMATTVFACNDEAEELEVVVLDGTSSENERVVGLEDEGDGYVAVYLDDEETPEKNVGSSSQKRYQYSEELDKTHYGETRYANVADFLALRSRPTSDSKELARLDPNTKMTVIGTTGNWIKVYVPSEDRDGYVYSKYASKTMR